MKKKFALVSTIDDHNGNSVRLFGSQEAAEKAGRKYICDEHPEVANDIDAAMTDREFMSEVCNYLGITEWIFVIEVSR